MVKKLFAIAVLATMTLCASAQEDIKKFRFGPTAGLNISTMNLVASHSARVGFNVGALAECNFTDNIFMTGALKYSQKGVAWDGIMSNGGDLKANPGYIEIPIHVGYRYSFNDKFSLFADFGPYFAVGVSGEYKADGYTSESFYDCSIPDLNGKSFDMVLGASGGAEYSNIQLRIGYDFGLTKAFDATDSAKNRNFYVGVGYMF